MIHQHSFSISIVFMWAQLSELNCVSLENEGASMCLGECIVEPERERDRDRFLSRINKVECCYTQTVLKSSGS